MQGGVGKNSGKRSPGTGEAPSHGAGTLFVGDGYIDLDGWIGENAAHSHLAFQLSIGLDGPIELIGDETRLVADAILIAPNTRHWIGPVGRRVRSIYVEPQLPWARIFAGRLGGRRMMSGAAELIALTDRPNAADDSRATRLRALIESAPAEQGPGDWAKAWNLSPSRFRALCVELLGAPPIRLRQWARLKTAARALMDGAGPAEAAAAAGYADQAHFTRQLRRWFGVSPARGLASHRIRAAR
jgi:AraC-like DNA-binding protein